MIPILRALRPKQWIKNVLLLAAPMGASLEPSSENLLQVSKGLIGFSLAASAGYVVNDFKDRVNDSNHKEKATRPFASGELSGAHAVVLVTTLILFSFLLSSQLGLHFTLYTFGYLVLTLCYTLWLKRVPVLEMIVVAGGFLLRALAGAVAVNVSVSKYFLLVAGFGSLFLISSKRLAELKNYQDNLTRAVIIKYSQSFLVTVNGISITVTLVMFSQWAFEVAKNSFWGQLSIIPVLIALLRYLWKSESTQTEAPETAIFQDQLVPLCGIIAFALLFLAIYT
jgi:decaprenyl-phosphate phosphoribosyltransferase